ncbi:hypothetical protein phytr_11010 [Candidatus Phycorickettsia trachydisci]|uniref:Uncharacterized protein n=1 Tax=Candidatus Phycorickettsia trachydisci TaxID=2115978 RepID=A0A2P1P9T2_9RICK|nr:ankyrin repeat domain-containing protein [Candidatus Phycorickettsia trachydisci]AVP88027.1 hypothetical protein phytr_11010 [Candidatus Phycorickettsia trachydisci]
MQEIINAIEARNEELAIRLIRESGFDFGNRLPPLNPGNNPVPTPLHYAAKQGLINVIRCLLDHGADFDAKATWYYPDIPNESGSDSETPSRWAIYYNQLEALKELWKNGLPEFVDTNKSEKAYLLTKAARKGHLEIVKWLIEKGFPIDGVYDDVPISDAFLWDQYNVVEYLLNEGASIDYESDETPVLEAEGFMNFLRELLVHRDEFKFSNKFLVIAIDQFGAEEEIRLLVEQGYDLERVDHEGITLIQAAVLKENIEVIETLLNRAVDINNVDPHGYNVLDYALCSQNEEVINLFHRKGFNILERQIQGNKYGLWAVMQGDSENIVKAIMQGREQAIHTMQEKGLDLNCRTGNLLETPMHYAARQNHADVVQLLIKFGADVNIMDDDQQTPLYIAVTDRHPDIVNFLIDKGKALTSLPKDLLRVALEGQTEFEIAIKLLNSGIYIDIFTFSHMYRDKLVPKICEQAFKYDLSVAVGALMNISTACFKLNINEKIKKGVRETLHKYYLKQGYDKIIKALEKIIKNKNSQAEDSLEKYKEAIKLFVSIVGFEGLADNLVDEVKTKFKQDLKASKNIICDMPFPYIQSKIYPQQPLLNLISSFIPPKKQIVFTEICKDAPIFSKLQNLNHEFQPESRVQKTGEDGCVPVVDDI